MAVGSRREPEERKVVGLNFWVVLVWGALELVDEDPLLYPYHRPHLHRLLHLLRFPLL